MKTFNKIFLLQFENMKRKHCKSLMGTHSVNSNFTNPLKTIIYLEITMFTMAQNNKSSGSQPRIFINKTTKPSRAKQTAEFFVTTERKQNNGVIPHI